MWLSTFQTENSPLHFLLGENRAGSSPSRPIIGTALLLALPFNRMCTHMLA